MPFAIATQTFAHTPVVRPRVFCRSPHYSVVRLAVPSFDLLLRRSLTHLSYAYVCSVVRLTTLSFTSPSRRSPRYTRRTPIRQSYDYLLLPIAAQSLAHDRVRIYTVVRPSRTPVRTPALLLRRTLPCRRTSQTVARFSRPLDDRRSSPVARTLVVRLPAAHSVPRRSATFDYSRSPFV